MRHLRPMVPPWLRWRSLFQPSVVLRVNIVRCRRRPFDKIRVIRWRPWQGHDGRIWAVRYSSVDARVIRPERSIWHDPTVGEGNVSSRAVRHGGRGCEPTEEKKACGDHLLLQSPQSRFATLLHSRPRRDPVSFSVRRPNVDHGQDHDFHTKDNTRQAIELLPQNAIVKPFAFSRVSLPETRDSVKYQSASFSIMQTYVIEKEARRFKELEYVLMEKKLINFSGLARGPQRCVIPTFAAAAAPAALHPLLWACAYAH